MSIADVEITRSIKSSYADYAIENNSRRHIPDVRDGLKPVHRRILFDMLELGLLPEKPYVKSARIVGDTLGRFHPHGDSSVYEALVRLAQNFSLMYPLVHGHGNFGGIDGSKFAGMRYTEAKLSKFSEILMQDTKEGFVPFQDNFDEKEREPLLVGGLFPNLLVNGATGMGVGISTNIPSHNLGSICDALVRCLEDYTVPIDDLIEIVKAPDFNNGGIVYGDFKKMYKTGKGSFTIESDYEIEEEKNKERIIFKNIPYGNTTSAVFESIADFCKDIDEVLDVRDESDEEGIRLIVEVRRNFSGGLVETLFKKTPLRTWFHANLTAVLDEKPMIFNLKQMLLSFLKHQIIVLRNKTKFEIDSLKKSIMLLEGRNTVLSDVQTATRLMYEANDEKEARLALEHHFGINEIQSANIMDSKFQRLTKSNRDDLINLIAEKKQDLVIKEKLFSDSVLQRNELISRINELKMLSEKRKCIIR